MSKIYQKSKISKKMINKIKISKKMINNIKISKKMINNIKILRIIAIVSFFPALLSFILWLAGLLDIKIMAIINWITFVVILSIFLIIAKNYPKINASVIIPKGSCEEKMIMAETNIFPNFLVPTNIHRNCIFRISLQIKEFKKYPLLYLIRICETDTCIQELNTKIKLEPDFVHVFEVAIDRKEKLNFKFNEDVNIKKFLVEELYLC